MCHLYLDVKRSLLGVDTFLTPLRCIFIVTVPWASGEVMLLAKGRAGTKIKFIYLSVSCFRS